MTFRTPLNSSSSTPNLWHDRSANYRGTNFGKRWPTLVKRVGSSARRDEQYYNR